MSELETKAGAGNVGAAFEDFMRAFEAFKETNDERLEQLERRSGADPLTRCRPTRRCAAPATARYRISGALDAGGSRASTPR